MPIGGFNEPIWHQNWKEDRQRPRNNPSELRAPRDVLVILAVVGVSLAAILGYLVVLTWMGGRWLP